MRRASLLRTQWEGYARYHRSRANLLLHLVAVPAFLAGNVALLLGILQGSWALAAGAVATTLAALGLQRYGHGREAVPPEPFRGPGNALARIVCEQWVTFPRFVLSGGWAEAVRNARTR